MAQKQRKNPTTAGWSKITLEDDAEFKEAVQQINRGLDSARDIPTEG